MRIGFASADWAVNARGPDGRPTFGGSGWARSGLPAAHLRAAGLDVVEGTLVFSKSRGVFLVRKWPTPGQDETDASLYHEVDLIVLQRWMFASVAIETATARANGQVVVNDVDDHFWALDPRNRAYQSTDPKRNPVENRDLYLAALRASSAVTVSTPYLADVLKRAGVRCRIEVLENHVDLMAFHDVYEDNRIRQAFKVGRFVQEALPVVGWVGATSWRSGDLETLRGTLGPFLRQHGLLAYHGGHQAGAQTFKDAVQIEGQVLTTGMVPIHEYPTLFRGLDVGLVPLRDVAFNRAKSWIKGLEYAAAGVPFVAADLPEYVRLHARFGIGRLARRPRDWTRHLGALLTPEARAEEVVANHAAAKALDIRQGIGQWAGLYLELLAAA